MPTELSIYAMKRNNFLIIGAMKAGTTTLFNDLSRHPDIYFPIDKEPSNLAKSEALTSFECDEYLSLFKDAPENSICGEASTRYSMRDKHACTAENALAAFGSDLKVIYLIRNPVNRLISHYQHERQAGRIQIPIDQAISRYDRLVDYSRYGYQLEPWLKTFKIENIVIIDFEKYTNNRKYVVNELCGFLSVSKFSETTVFESVHNSAANKPLAKGPIYAISQSQLYRDLIRPLLKSKTRDIFRHLLLPRSKTRKESINAETLTRIQNIFEEDAQKMNAALRVIPNQIN